MKIYLVIEQKGYEDYEIHGVFSSLNKADSYICKNLQYNIGNVAVIDFIIDEKVE